MKSLTKEYSRIFSLFGWLFIVPHFLGLAQPPAGVFFHLTTKNGLSSNRSTAVIEDQKGYYWIATEDGLNRFDGTSCKIFRNLKGDSQSLSNNYCMQLLEDDLGKIWIGTAEGVSIYDPEDGKFRRTYFHLPLIADERVNSIRGMSSDELGNIYVCSYGLWQYNIHSGKWKSYSHNPSDPASIPAGYFHSPVFDGINNGLWMKSSAGYVFFDLKTNKFYHRDWNPKKFLLLHEECDDSRMVLAKNSELWFFNPQSLLLESYSLKNNIINRSSYKTVGSISDLSMDSEDRIWIHYWNRPTAIFSPAHKTIDSNFLRSYHLKSALSQMASSLFTDRMGNFWICSKNGVSIYDAHSQAVSYYTLPQNPGDGHLLINCVAEKNEKQLWVGTNLGLFLFDLSTLKLEKLKDPFKTDHFIRSLCLQSDSVLWIGGQSGLARYDLRKNLMIQYTPFSSPVQSIFPGRDNMWIGTWTDGLYSFSWAGQMEKHLVKSPDLENSLYSNNLLCISGKPHAEYFWLGYNGGNGFSKLFDRGGSFQHFKLEASPDAAVSNSVNCIAEDNRGALWIGTFGGGLYRTDGSDRRPTHFSQNEGLSGDYINAIFADDSQRIWISTCNGLDILDIRTETVLNTGIDLDQASNDLIANCIERRNKKLLFFARNRIVEVSPAGFLQNSFPSSLLLNSFKIFDKEIFLPDAADRQTVRLSYQENFFSFDYSLLKPDPDGYVQYAYLLEGFDPNWNFVRYRHFANYTNVPPGQYTFRIKATDKSGKWRFFSKPLVLIISPPFWKTWWFITFLVVLAGTVFYSLFRNRISQLRRMYQLRSGISKDLHDQIGATLTSISFLSEVAKKQTSSTDASVKTLEKIGDYSRDMMAEMNDIVWAINPQNDSFEKVIDRMENFALPFLSSRDIHFSFHCEEPIKTISLNMEQRKNLYLIFKEAINNAAKYAGCSAVSVRLKKENSHLRMDIMDNGRGFSQTGNGSGNGLRNMQHRAGEIKGKLEVISQQGHGTQILLQFPITQNAD